MAIEDDLNQMKDQHGQIKAFRNARKLLKDATALAQTNLATFKDVKAQGTFDLLPTSVKTAALAWEDAFDTLKTTITTNADLLALYQWDD